MTAMKSLVLGAIFFLPLSLMLAALLMGSAGLLLAIRMVRTGRISLRWLQMDYWVVGFLFLAALSVVQSAHAAAGWYNYFYVVGLQALVYFLISRTIQSEREAKSAVLAVLASALFVCAWGLLQYQAGIDVTAERWIDGDQFPGLKTRVYSTLGNPNVLASFLIMAVGLAAGWSTDPHINRYFPFLLAGLAFIAILCIILTYSRGAWLALGGMALMMGCFSRRWNWRIFLIGGITATGLLVLMQESLISRFLSIKGMFNPADSSVALRWALWESTLAMVQEHPWLGIGWGAYRFVYPEYDFFVQNESVIIYHGHNTLLSLAAEIGIAGMLFFAALWGLAVVRAWKAMQKAGRTSRGFYLGWVLALLGTAAFSLTDHALFNEQVAAVFWVLVALTAALPREKQDGG